MIYICQYGGKNRLQRRLEILLGEFLLPGSLDTIIPVGKQGVGEGAALLCFLSYSWMWAIIFSSVFLPAGPELCLPAVGAVLLLTSQRNL